MKRLSTIIFAIAILGLAAKAYCYQADVIDISGSKYFPAVKDALSKAQKSIYLVMYFVNFDPKAKNSRVNELAAELVNAHKRGVKVKVILDQNVSFVKPADRSEIGEREAKNNSLFAYLKEQGIEAYFDNIFVTTHSKAIVIDEEVVILGSANWTESSLYKNREASCLAVSKELAQEFLRDFNEITLDYEASAPVKEKLPPVRVSDSFIKAPSLAPRMVTARDDKAFDLYLLLLRNFDGNSEGKVDIDYKSISSIFGLDEKFSYEIVSHSLRQALGRLEKNYNLIRHIKSGGPKNPYCLLLNFPSEQPYVYPKEDYCAIPDEYWQYGWNKRLSFPEKYILLISLRKTASSRGRAWSDHRAGIMEDFHLSRSTVIRGIMGLRKLNIIEIEYPPYPKEDGFANRAPMNFRYLGLYSPERLRQEKERLASLYGKQRFALAAKYARIVYKENDIQVLEDIIKKMEEYGAQEVKKAFGKVSYRSADNPKRSYRYVVGILQNEAKIRKGTVP